MPSESAQGVEPPRDPRAPHTATARELKQLLEAERSGAPFLCFRDPDGELILRGLSDHHDHITLGRRTTADIAIQWDAEVSGLHAELVRLAGEWTIIDDGLSSNG